MDAIENDLLSNRPIWIELNDKGQVVISAELMREWLSEEIEPLIRRRDELLGSCQRAPAAIEDETTSGKVADLTKLISACIKNAEADRVSRKEPFLEGGRIVDGLYKQITEPLTKSKTEVERKLTLWQRQKAEEERRRREEEARRQAEEAERARRIAAEAEAKLRTERDVEAAIAAEEAARQREADAVAARRAAEAKPAELSRERSDLGAVASLRRFWDWTDLDRDQIDLEALRPHLPLDAIEKAVRSYIKAGGYELRGVVIFENTTTSVR